MLKLLHSTEVPELGRGVFWCGWEDLPAGYVVHESDLLLIPIDQKRLIDKTILANYYFDWDDKHLAMAMDVGSFFNHSYEPNVVYERDFNYQKIVFKTLRNIQWGEELRINYNGDPNDNTPVPFRVR